MLTVNLWFTPWDAVDTYTTGIDMLFRFDA
jgi:hypothetical protein